MSSRLLKLPSASIWLTFNISSEILNRNESIQIKEVSLDLADKNQVKDRNSELLKCLMNFLWFRQSSWMKNAWAAAFETHQYSQWRLALQPLWSSLWARMICDLFISLLLIDFLVECIAWVWLMVCFFLLPNIRWMFKDYVFLDPHIDLFFYFLITVSI